MDIRTFDTSLTKYRTPIKVADLEWKKVSPEFGFQPTAEMKAEVAAMKATAARTQAYSQAQIDANPESFFPNGENNHWGLTNVATLKPEEIAPKISQITNLIQSGEAEKYEFFSGNGEVTTRSIHQYLYWLQLRQLAMEPQQLALDSDGTYTPTTFP